MSGPWLGIDVGGTTTRLGCMDADGSLMHRTAATPPTLDAFLDTLERLRDEVGTPRKVAGIGVGLPGVVDAAGARWLPKAPQLAVADLADRIGERLGTAVVLGNESHGLPDDIAAYVHSGGTTGSPWRWARWARE